MNPLNGQSGAGMVHMFISPRNAHQWRAISYFLAGFEVMATARVQAEKTACAAHGKRSAGAAQAGVSALPDGNHGDNRRSIK